MHWRSAQARMVRQCRLDSNDGLLYGDLYVSRKTLQGPARIWDRQAEKISAYALRAAYAEVWPRL